MKKRFTHTISVSLLLESNDEFPTGKEMLEKLKEKMIELESLNETELINEFEIFDSEEN